MIFNYYESLTARVITKSFTSKPFHYSIGIFQGCTMSPTLLNITIQLLLDYINQIKCHPLSYTFNAISLLTSAYADDIQITASKPDYNQKLLNYVDKFLNWSRTMEAKPSKCCTLAMKTFDHRYINKSLIPLGNCRYSHYDPNLFLSGERITPITDEGFKYLGVRIEWTLQEKQSRGRIKEILINLVNSTHVANTAKLWLYNHHNYCSSSVMVVYHFRIVFIFC